MAEKMSSSMPTASRNRLSHSRNTQGLSTCSLSSSNRRVGTSWSTSQFDSASAAPRIIRIAPTRRIDSAITPGSFARLISFLIQTVTIRT